MAIGKLIERAVGAKSLEGAAEQGDLAFCRHQQQRDAANDRTRALTVEQFDVQQVRRVHTMHLGAWKVAPKLVDEVGLALDQR